MSKFSICGLSLVFFANLHAMDQVYKEESSKVLEAALRQSEPETSDSLKEKTAALQQELSLPNFQVQEGIFLEKIFNGEKYGLVAEQNLRDIEMIAGKIIDDLKQNCRKRPTPKF